MGQILSNHINPNQSPSSQSTQSSRRTPGDLDLDLDGVPVDGEYMILDTDYTSYAAVYSCQASTHTSVSASHIIMTF